MLFECYAYNIDCQHQHKSSCCLVRLSARTSVYKCWTIKWLLLKLLVTLWPLEVSPLANTHTVQNAFIKLTCNTAKKSVHSKQTVSKETKTQLSFSSDTKNAYKWKTFLMKLPPTNQNINFPQKYFILIV